jgi:pyrroloquinoline quinone biosynthesis protein B
MTTFLSAAAILFAIAGAGRETSPSRWEAVVLGIAQDGGVPHAGCHQPLCESARRDPSRRRRVASLGIVERGGGKRFLVDATPDFPEQMELLGGLPDAILLTHAHIGHYLGLAQLGREVLGARGVPVYCTPSMAAFLRENGPWRRLVTLGNIQIREVALNREWELAPGLRVTAVPVPHRGEDSDNVAYRIAGASHAVLWLPDIDRWELWDRHLEAIASERGLTAFLDGTFWAADEIPGRAISDIPHPLVSDTMARAGRPVAEILFVHLNHTNRLLWDESAAAEVRSRGFGIAREGARYPL